MDKKTQNMVDGLSCLLANTYTVLIHTQYLHWNIRGAHFYAYHKLFEEQYKQLAEAVDDIAERIRAVDLEGMVRASLKCFSELKTIEEHGKSNHDQTMIEALLNDHRHITAQIQEKLFTLAKEADDEVTLDLLIQRKAEHDKTIWMLDSLLRSQ